MPPIDLPSIPFQPLILVPTFNNAGALGGVLGRITPLGVETLVVNDGSTDATAQLLQSIPAVTVLAHSANEGKAAALKTGFVAAAQRGFTHVLTIDADGQHDPEQIPALLNLARQHPAAIILGTRDERSADYPFLSKWGRRISNSLVWMESGLSLRDSQCGLRVYPLDFVNSTPCSAGRYGFETEILTRAGWAQRPIVQTEVNCFYLPPEKRVSHFRPLVDSLRSLAMHARLMRCAPHLSPSHAWRQMRNKPAARAQFAGGLAVGVFVSCLPIYGLQAVASVLAARWFKLNRLSALAGSQMSTPPLSAVLIFASIAAGHLLLHGTWPDAAWWQTVHSIHMTALIRAFLLEWIVGGTLVGLILAITTYAVVLAALGRGAAAPTGSAGPSV